MRAPRLLILGIALVVVLATASIAAATFASSASTGPLDVSTRTLSAPGSFTATANCVKPNLSVALSWTASNFASGYTIYRAAGTGAYSQLATVGSGATSYNDTTVLPVVTYHYYAVATFQAWTAQSATANATTLTTACK